MGLIALLLNQECTVRPYIRMGGGEPLFGEEETRPCRLERGQHQVCFRRDSGQTDQVEARARLFCEGGEIPPGSRVTCEGESYTVANCVGYRRFDLDHQEVYLL